MKGVLMDGSGHHHHHQEGLKKGPWTAAEDAILVAYVNEHGEGNWNSVQKHSGLSRCGKSCRLRWANHLRPNLKKGAFTPEEERIIIDLHSKLGNKWARMAALMPGRTDNEIKNYWNTRIKRRMRAGLSLYPPDVVGPSDGLCKLERGLVASCSNTSAEFYHPMNHCCEIPLMSHHHHQGICGRMKREARHENSLEQLSDESSVSVQRDYNSYFKVRRSCSNGDHGFLFQQDPNVIVSRSNPNPDSNNNNNSSSSNNVNAYSAFGSARGGGLKLELPSSQSAGSAGSADTPNSNISSPNFSSFALPSRLVSEADSFGSSSNAGLLEALLQEAQSTNYNNNSYVNNTDGDGAEETKPELLVPGSNYAPLDDHVTAAMMNSQQQNNPNNNDIHPTTCAFPSFTDDARPNRSQWEDSSSLQTVLEGSAVIKTEIDDLMLNESHHQPQPQLSHVEYTDEEISTLLDFAKTDHVTLPDWYDHSSISCCGLYSSIEPTAAAAADCSVPDAINSVFSNQVGEVLDLDHPMSMPGSISMNQYMWELGSCSWNNMPGACQLTSDSPNLTPCTNLTSAE